MTEPAPVKRHRSANWEMDEKKLMRDVIKPYLHIIETKKLTLEANAAKINAWKEITEKFNKVNDTTRSMKQIMIQWKINKNICKAKFAAHCIPKMGPLKVLQTITPTTAPPLKLGVSKIKEEPQESSSNLIELDSYNVMSSTPKGSKMTNVVITCAKPKALKEDGKMQKLVVIPASITKSETTDPLETNQDISHNDMNDPLGIEDVIIPVPVEIPEITEEIVTEQMDDEYYDDIADTATPTSPEVAKEEMTEEVPATSMATSPKEVSKSPEREAEKVLEEDPVISKLTKEDVPQSSDVIAEKIVAEEPGAATNTEPAQKPIRRRRKRTSKAAKEDNNATKTANQEAADQQFLSYSQAVYNDKAHYRKLENERLTAEHSLRMTCMSEQHQEIIKILKLQQEVLKKQLNNGHGSTTT